MTATDPNQTVKVGNEPMNSSRILLTILLCVTASVSAGARTYLVSFELTVEPLDGGEAFSSHVDARQIPPSSGTMTAQIPVCSGRYDCAISISQVQGRKGKLTVSFTEYDSPEVPSRIVSEISETVGFSLGVPDEFETKTISAGIRLDFIIEEGPELASTYYGEGESVIRIAPLYKDGKVVGARLYPGRDQRRFANLGLKSGEIVVSSGELRLVDAASVDAFETLRRAGKVKSVMVLRNGNPVVVPLE